MTIFNSQRINTDRFPWIVVWEDGYVNRYASHLAAAIKADAPGRSYGLAPRPEFDNNPNPILLDFREANAHRDGRFPTTQSLASAWADYLERGGLRWHLIGSASPEHVAHAHKVLQRLAALERLQD